MNKGNQMAKINDKMSKLTLWARNAASYRVSKKFQTLPSHLPCTAEDKLFPVPLVEDLIDLCFRKRGMLCFSVLFYLKEPHSLTTCCSFWILTQRSNKCVQTQRCTL